MRFIVVLFAALFATPSFAEDTPKPQTVDMTQVLYRTNGEAIKDCPTGYKGDGKDCPDLTLSGAANYAVSFAIESDKSIDWHERAHLRKILDDLHGKKDAILTHAESDSLMNRIGNLYKLLGNGDETIVATMKILQPAEYAKLSDSK